MSLQALDDTQSCLLPGVSAVGPDVRRAQVEANQARGLTFLPSRIVSNTSLTFQARILIQLLGTLQFIKKCQCVWILAPRGSRIE
jgi:hypothetical protein